MLSICTLGFYCIMLDNYYDCTINLFLQEKMFDLINFLLGSLSEGKKREVKSEYI